VDLPAVEAHISDIDQREEWRRKSVISEACVAMIKGKGIQGYIEALEFLAARAATEVSS